MKPLMTRETALALLCKYNKEPFHLLHALTVESVMRWFAQDQGYGAEADFWALAGLLHDIDLNFGRRSTAGKRRSCCAQAGRTKR